MYCTYIGTYVHTYVQQPIIFLIFISQSFRNHSHWLATPSQQAKDSNFCLLSLGDYEASMHTYIAGTVGQSRQKEDHGSSCHIVIRQRV